MFLTASIVSSAIPDIGSAWRNFFTGAPLTAMYIASPNVSHCRSAKNTDVDKYKIGIRTMFIHLYLRTDQ